MRLKTRIWMLPLSAAVIFAVALTVVLVLSARTSDRLQSVGQVDYPFLDIMTQFSAQVEAYGGLIQSAVAEGEKQRLDDAKERAKQARELIARLQAIPGKASEAQQLEAALTNYEAASISTAELFLGVKQGDQTASIPEMQAALKSLEELIAAKRKQATEAFDGALQSARSGVSAGLWMIAGAGLLVVVVLGVASYLVIGSIWRQLGGEPEYAVKVMRRMANGDLAQSVELQAGAEQSLLAAVRDMAGGLVGIVGGVRQGTDSITVSAREIARGNHDLSVRTERQAGSLEQTASSMRQLTEAVRASAQSAQQANQVANSSAEVAGRGGAVVAQVIETMEEINASSRKINDIIGTIDGIAFQTNILALNAAVEAARAGEQGRGFAVVAGEVRGLAQRSADAAKEIKSLIGASVEKVEAGTYLVRNAGATMDEIQASVRRVGDMIAEITAATAAQTQGIEQVNTSIGSLDQMTQQNAALVEEAAAAASSMEQQAVSLQSAVATFKLD
ncbi:MAG: methyl-accepting chemotaxis protein [Inhella sp.]|uniref:methyl-accepting chemotaxis protein n=1 Tax=Inhella sp. TaxID=1921806 RepID=UPI003919F7DD